MDYAIENVPECATTITLLEAVGVEPTTCKAVWYGFPQAEFIVPDRFGDQVEVTSSSMRVFEEADCMASALLEIVNELRRSTECTCTFGHEGAFQLISILGDGCQKKGNPVDVALVRELADAAAAYASCDEGRAMGRAVLQALELFGEEIAAHFEKRRCPTGGCAAFKTVHILVSRCTGCGACLKACEDGAIMGKPRFVHVVDQGKCTQCKRCQEACPEQAVVLAGAKKPKTPPRPIPVKR